MADYENRLRRLEDIAVSADDRDDVLLKLTRQRAAELLSSPQVLAYTGPEVSDEEWAVEWATFQAAVKATQGKR